MSQFSIVLKAFVLVHLIQGSFPSSYMSKNIFGLILQRFQIFYLVLDWCLGADCNPQKGVVDWMG